MAEAAVPMEAEAVAFMAAEVDRTAAAECLAAAARHAGAAVRTAAAGPTAAADPQAPVSLNAAAANRAVHPRDVQVQWDVRVAVRPGPAERRRLTAVQTDSAEADPA